MLDRSLPRRLLALAILSLGPVPPALQAQQQATPQPESAQAQLWDAAMQGDTAAMAAALARGAAVDSLDVRRSPNGRRALNWAAWFDRPAAIEFLVRHGATIDLENRTGFTPLHHAAEHGSLGAATALLQLGADPTRVNERGERPLDVARGRGQDWVAALLERSTPQ